jgi:hypothetical protein
MSSSATPRQRKRVEQRRARRPTRPARGQFEDIDSSPADTKPAGDPGSFIEPVTKDDPTATRQASVQEHPPRAPGP